MAATRSKITHVIFDVDGLLLDTEIIYTKVVGDLCAEYGKEFTWEIKAKQMGQTEVKAANIIIDILQLPLTAEEYIRRCKERLMVLFPSAPLMPGAERLVRHLHAHHVPIALASGSDQQNYELKTQNHRALFSLFQHAVLSSSDPEVKSGKPAPDCFLVAAARFSSPPASMDHVLVFEDAPNGVESGHAAGMQVVWVPDPRADRSALEDKVAVILDSLEQFRPQDFGLPPYDA